MKFWLFACVCIVLLVGCSDDGGSPLITGAPNTDPSFGYLINSTKYRLIVDLDKNRDFTITLEPGMLTSMSLQAESSHVAHVVLLNESGRPIAEYVNSFYINDIPLDNQVRDFVCSWYAEFISESGFANKFGS